MKKNIIILIATHKKYRMPKESIYLPIHVGAEGKTSIGFQGDNTGENISSMNPRLCELTAVYWAWKNLDAEYIGLTHYRRHFTAMTLPKRFLKRDKFELILKENELMDYIKNYDVLVPNKRKYYIESLRSHFIHLPYTYESDLRIFEKTMKKMAPDYAGAYDTVMNRSWAHMFNMFIMKKDIFDKYCEWLFPILFEVDKKIDVSKYTPMEARAAAYFGEFMLDIWLEKNLQRLREVGVMFMERQNWIVKGGRFVWRKINESRKH